MNTHLKDELWAIQVDLCQRLACFLYLLALSSWWQKHLAMPWRLCAQLGEHPAAGLASSEPLAGSLLAPLAQALQNKESCPFRSWPCMVKLSSIRLVRTGAEKLAGDRCPRGLLLKVLTSNLCMLSAGPLISYQVILHSRVQWVNNHSFSFCWECLCASAKES